MKTPFLSKISVALALLCAGRADAAQQSPGRLPVVEVTAFKDGHAFVAQEGDATANAAGEIMLDDAPSPVLGTFWVYSTDKNVKVASVVAGRRIVPIDRTAMSLRELIEANPNAKAVITETNQAGYTATIIGFLTRSTHELAETSPPNSPEQPAQKSNILLVQTDLGEKALSIDQIQTITFKDKPGTSAAREEFRNYLRVKVAAAANQAPVKTAGIGLVYLQKGIRWIPEYRVELDGKGQASIKLQATVINDMIDLTNVTLNLVIGVPSFAFKDTIDPMAAQETAEQLSQFFQGRGADNNGYGRQVLAQNFSNAMISQQRSAYVDPGAGLPPPSDLPSDLPAGAKNEDLYVFTLRNITLRKGERMLLPISEQTVNYQDVFTLDIPFAPPSDMGRNLNNQQQLELARLMDAPKVMHKARLTNSGKQPFTTAPALVLRDGRVIAQGMMTYAAPGAAADIALTTAVDIQVKKSDIETNRVPNALAENGDSYFRVNLKGGIRLVNRRGASVEIEVNRYVLGQVDQAGQDGKIEMVNFFEDRQYLPAGTENSVQWWNWYNWPWWWDRVNGAGRVTWNFKLDAGQSIDLDYAWHYFWR
jgi:hypothetical protein